MLIGTLAILVGLWVVLAVVVACSFRAFLYPAPPGSDFASRAKELRTFVAKDGAKVHALHFRAPSPRGTIVHFHGNGELIDGMVPIAELLREQGLDVMLVEYRGYGASASSGPPSEQGLYADAEAALDALASEGTGPDRVVLFGTSLGTGVATEMAVRGRGRALVLVTPYTSIPAVAARLVPLLLPVRFLLRDRFDNLSKAPRITVPTLIVHGTRDEIVPYGMGNDLALSIPGARLLTLEGAHHNDVYARPEVLRAIAAHALGAP